ncbi:MAG: citramalate synthase [Elusimicrobia bacterium RIFOXYA2_FULL_39_19]|nr:MAG: citramalate synthase [Elusimicrobia bacterium RIFOXYA2_FULL_39_19]
MTQKKIFLFDTTLRDGSQSAGVSFSAEDKIKVAKALDDFGIDFIEGGWPGSNPKDELFFEQAHKGMNLKKAKIVAFGSTRHKDKQSHVDSNLLAIVNSKVQYASIFGKAWDFHVIHALRATLEENIEMIEDSVKFLKQKGLGVVYDAEHFFDGFKANRNYALKTIEAAVRAGAFNITFCDTNGGTMPNQISEIIKEVKNHLNANNQFSKMEYSLGIHAHNDSECAVANTLVAVLEGATMVQGTINGYGERCGNANLCSIIPNLEIKLGYKCLPEDKLKGLYELSRHINEIANVIPNDHQPYVGKAAFTHKAGIHVSAVQRHSSTYEHVEPTTVGNERKVLISELAGKSNVMFKIKELNLDFDGDKDVSTKVIDLIKKMEHKGYQYEDADASFALLVRKASGIYNPFFELKGFRVVVQKESNTGEMVSEAIVKLDVKGTLEHTVAEGDGPVNALDNALRKALEKFYPELKEMSLSDFKVRIINPNASTGAITRVLIESKDKKETWGTVGISENIIEASWQALSEAVEYKLLKESARKKK